ncbi:F-box/kelch-repeat protein At3g23880-like [Castanea sativa]|uniref:F-box/kelch-repeat protein At3g23880-like n=1 Tax=Castanea sativa TaxID=21020 RepID=UPI003F650362
MSQTTTTTRRELLPDDVVEDILVHLPVKSLTRFRCVSKSCDSIITDPPFITKHLKLNLNQSESLKSTNTHSGYLLYTTKDKNSSSSSSSKKFCTAVCNNDRTLTQVSRCEIPSFFDKCNIDACCNGLFCMVDYALCHIIYLWNPSIRMFKKLLATPSTDEDMWSVIGLAYNSKNNDFKILRLVSFWGQEAEAEAEIYSLSTDSWRKVVITMESLRGYEPDFGIIYIYPACIFFNGALHSVAASIYDVFILSFNVNDESFREIMLPPNFNLSFGTPGIFTELALFKGSLAVFIYGDNQGVLCHLWVMEEYGVAESWTRKYMVEMDWFWDGHFFGFADNGELLIKNAFGLVSIDLESQNQNILAIEGADWVGSTTNSMESLILLNGGK